MKNKLIYLLSHLIVVLGFALVQNAYCSEKGAFAAITKKIPELPEKKENKKVELEALKKEVSALIQTLEKPEKREALIKQLTLLIDANKEDEDPFDNFLSDITQFVESHIQRWQNTLYDLSVNFYHFPKSFIGALKNFKVDPYGPQTSQFLLIIFIAFVVGLIIEFFVTSLMKNYLSQPIRKLSKNNPLVQYPVYRFLHRCIIRFVPLIVFGMGTFFCLSAFVKPNQIWAQSALSFATIVTLMRVGMILITALLEPNSPECRPFGIAQEHASNLHSSGHLLFWIATFGLLFNHTMALLGLPSIMLSLWAKVMGLIWCIALILEILRYKNQIANWLIFKIKMISRTPASTPKVMVSLAAVLMKSWHVWAIGCILMLYFVWLFDSSEHMLALCGEIASTLTLGVVLIRANIAFAQWYQYSKKFHQENFSKSKPDFLELTERPISVGMYLGKFLAPSFQFLLSIVGIIGLAKIWGIDLLEILSDSSYQAFFLSVFEVFLIVMITKILWLTTNLVVQHQLQSVEINGIIVEPSVFIKTIAPIVRTTIHIFLIFICTLLVLKSLNFEILPLLYGFSLIGFAISLGSQSLIKDLINGILTLMEDNIAVGEFVKIGNETGIVESITLRSVFLRHGNGALQSIPFSEVASIINLSRDFNRCSFDIGFPYQTPLDQIMQVINLAASDIQNDEIYGPRILEPLIITGVSHFTDTAVYVSGFFKVTPDPTNRVLKQFQYYLKNRMDEADISSPILKQIILGDSLLENNER